MAIRLGINPRHAEGLARVRDLSPSLLDWAVRRLETLDSLRVDDLKLTLAEKINEVDAIELVKHLLSAVALRRQRGVSPEEVFDALTIGISQLSGDSRWDEDEMKRWHDIKSQLVMLFGNKQLSGVAKALDLAYDYANVLQAIRIITDVRPVFDDDESIQGTVVSQILRMTFENSGERKTLSIAMDAHDVGHLQTCCERAIRKAAAIQESMAERLGLPVLIAGQNDEVSLETS